MAREFNGSTDRIDWPNVADFTTGPRTLAFWIYADTAPGYNARLFALQTTADVDNSVDVFFSATQQLAFAISTDGATSLNRWSATDALALTAWHHVSITWDGGTLGAGIHIYVDGVEVASYTQTENADGNFNVNVGKWSVGGRYDDDTKNFDGRIAAPGAWTSVLTGAEIMALAQGKAPCLLASGLLFAPRLTGASPEPDPISTLNGTLDGTSFVADPSSTIFFDKPYTDSSRITAMTFDWTSHITLADGTDNWPLTWADDGHQYATGGDGSGFNAPTEESAYAAFILGRIEGTKDSYAGYNRLNGYEAEYTQTINYGCYGILCVNAVLYVWLTDWYATSYLYKSTNHGQSFTDTGVSFTYAGEGVSMPCFLQFGQNYAGARDGYIYIYCLNTTHNDSSLEPHTGGLALARCLIADIETKANYEWFTGLVEGVPQWTATVGDRTQVFSDANNVGPTLSVIYLPGPARYLLLTQHTRKWVGNIGIFEASEPWGPWTTVLYDAAFGYPTTEIGAFYWNFSPKWCAGDRFVLAFTGTSVPTNALDSWNTVEGRFTLEPRALLLGG